jgi:biopolymer transport protein ExbD
MQLPALKRKSLVNLTPLIDVVFILLIFFMLASNFIKWQSLELTVSEPEVMLIDDQILSVIQIYKNGNFSLNDEIMPLDQIIARVRERIMASKNHPVVIQPEKGSRVQLLVNTLDKLEITAGTNISLAKFNQDSPK